MDDAPRNRARRFRLFSMESVPAEFMLHGIGQEDSASLGKESVPAEFMLHGIGQEDSASLGKESAPAWLVLRGIGREDSCLFGGERAGKRREKDFTVRR